MAQGGCTSEQLCVRKNGLYLCVCGALEDGMNVWVCVRPN